MSAVLDLSLLRKHEVATFMTGFMENLYRLKAREIYRTPMMLVIDEADAVAPQKPQKGEERMLGAAEDIVRRGGQRGIGCVLVSQRSAVLNKNVLTQAQILVALRTIAPQDLDAMKAWIDVHGTEEERKTLMESLPSLPVGDAWFWSPGWPTVTGIFKRVHVLPIETFDSGATPKPGEKRREPKTVADVDLESLKRQMSAVIEKQKADDPRELRKQLLEAQRMLQRQEKTIGELQARPHVGKEKRVEVPVLKDGQLARIEKTAESLRGLLDRVHELTDLLFKSAAEIRAAADTTKPAPAVPRPHQLSRDMAPTRMARTDAGRPLTSSAGPERPRRQVSIDTAGSNGHLPPGEKATLVAAAQYADGVTREQASILTGYKRSSRDAYIQRLLAKGYVALNGSNGNVVATDAGVQALGSDYEPLPTGEALQAYWLERLPPGEKAVLEVAIAKYPEQVDVETIDVETGYKRSSRDAYIQRLMARQLLTRGRGMVRATDVLFGV